MFPLPALVTREPQPAERSVARRPGIVFTISGRLSIRRREPATIGPVELLYGSRASTVMPVSYFGWRYAYQSEARMLVIWLGALFVLCGLLFMAAQPIWRGRLSDARRTSSAVPRDTLEPRRPGAGFGLKANWPGLVLIVLGGILLLAGAGL
jgi:hypothetical protein